MIIVSILPWFIMISVVRQYRKQITEVTETGDPIVPTKSQQIIRAATTFDALVR